MKRYKETRPWGSFDRFTHNEKSTVKILSINEGGETSLQFHYKREEFWKILSGHPKLRIGEEIFEAKPEDEFFVRQNQKHQISSPEGDAQILEISFGDFDEKDIVRLQDKYGRE